MLVKNKKPVAFSCRLCAINFTKHKNLLKHNRKFHSKMNSDSNLININESFAIYEEDFIQNIHDASFFIQENEPTINKCNKCEQDFSTKKKLWSHIKAKHQSNFKCDQCDNTFSKQSNLKKHVDSVHKEIQVYTCEHCNNCLLYTSPSPRD